MKRVLSFALCATILGGLLFTGGVVSATTTARPTVTLTESSFENGMESPFFANEDDYGNTATITPVSIKDSVNAYLHITDRRAGERASSVQQNVAAQLKANGADGKYYISARIKLDNAGDTAYVVPYIQGSKVLLQPGAGERFAVGGSWSEIGKKNDGSYMAFAAVDGTKDLTDTNLSSLTWCKIYLMMFTGASGSTTYDGSYELDDVNVWFVPNSGAPASVTQIGTNILTDGTFDANVAAPEAYNNLFDGTSWYIATADGSGAAADRLCTAKVETETVGAVDKTVVHAGTGSLHVTARPGAHQGLSVNMKDIVNEVGALSAGEGYTIDFWIRTDSGTMTVMPIFGSSKGNGFLDSEKEYAVTDQWTEITCSVPFALEGGGQFDPYGATWAAIRLKTDGSQNYYIDDFKVLGPQKPADAAAAFVQGVSALPAAASITYSDESTITALESAYAALDQSLLTNEQKSAVSAAKITLNAARAAFNALPPKKNSFQPTFTYSNKANLIAPYGDLETFASNDYIWNEENLEGGHPTYTLITDKTISHRGNNCLLVSDRTITQHAAAFTLTDVVKTNGAGKYYFSCWMKTKNPGDEMDVIPLLYVGGLAKEFYVKEDTFHITNQWTFVGVSYSNIDDYFRSNGEEMPSLDSKATYVSLRFYGANEKIEDPSEGALYPDYYIDDLAFWKYFDGQESYVDPNAPTTTTTTKTGGTVTTTSSGNGSNPGTGSSFPVALPILGTLSLACVLLTKKHRK